MNDNRLKMLTSLNQKVRGMAGAVRCRTTQPAIPAIPSADRRTPSRHSQIMRNMDEPCISPPQRGRKPQGVPKGARVKDVGESESRIVMMRTAAMPQPERAQTSDRWRITGKMRKGFAAGSTDRHRAFVPTGDGAADGKP